jgi:hypothetical protein
MSVIPKHLFDEFCAALDAANDDDAPDGAWWQMLEDASSAFMRKHRLRGSENSATHEYIQSRATKAVQK